MNNGDLVTEKNNMPLAMQEYEAAMKMFSYNLEMQYWTAITLAMTMGRIYCGSIWRLDIGSRK